jgi:glyoxylase-like metal-dependent hydrolase (beta-lactamase superfamily II)
MKITDDLYSYQWTSMWENNCNSYYIGGEVKTLIDPGLLVFYPELVKNLSRDGLEPDDIQNVLLTHSHPDHFEAVERFLSIDGTKIYMSKEESDFMEEVGKKFYPAFGLNVPDYRIDVYLEEGELTIGGEQFDVYVTPGHSPGSICLYWPEKKALFSGDLIFSRNVGRTDFPGGSGNLLKESIERMSELDIEYLLPGHMEPVLGSENVKENFELIKRGVFPYL